MDTQIIGLDLSTRKDYSVISSLCSNCHNIIESKIYEPEKNDCSLAVYKKCPKCGIEFNRHIIQEN